MNQRQQHLSGRQLAEYDQELETINLEDLKKMPWVDTVSAIEQNGVNYRCVRCNQTEVAKVEETSIVYCIHCLSLGRMSTRDKLYRFKAMPKVNFSLKSVMTWQGTLSAEQQRASDALIESLPKSDKVHIIQAVTGAGKTEMIFGVINKVLTTGGRVALVSPRIDVCLELAPRLKEAFQTIDLLTLHGRMKEMYRYTPLVIATNHQLLKFYQAFDLIIVDEVDAFPLANDEGLHFGVKQALKPFGKIIYLTATPDKYLNALIRHKKAEVTLLPARFHRHALPEPIFKWLADWRKEIDEQEKGQCYRVIQQFLKVDGIKLLFMPDIELAQKLYEWLKETTNNIKIEIVHAKDEQRIEKVQRLRQQEYDLLISTTILERGVTFTNCHVLIIGAEDRGYGTSALIQMSGRVGRKAEYPTGTLIFGHYGISWSMLKARKNIKRMNQMAKKMGLLNDY